MSIMHRRKSTLLDGDVVPRFRLVVISVRFLGVA